MPACEADSWREVFHDALQVAHASACVDAWPSFQVPESEVCPYLFVHVECGSTSKGIVYVSLGGLFVFVVIFFVERKWGVVGDGVSQVVFCKSKCAHGFFVVVECGAKMGSVPLVVLGCPPKVWGGA